jgi:hypothetical protein
MTADLLERLLARYGVELHTDVETDAWSEFPVTWKRQAAGDLGARLLAALPGLILGGDAPTVPLEHVDAMLASPADVTLGPTPDGGFWAIAARRIHPDMFQAVEWSSSFALDQTAAACRTCGFAVSLGPSWYDVDQPADLERLRADPQIGPRAAACIAEW